MSLRSYVPRTSRRSRPSRRSSSAKRKRWVKWQPWGICEKSGQPSARRMRKADQRRSPAQGIELIGAGHTARAGLVRACSEIGICMRTLKGWWKALIGDSDDLDRRKGSPSLVSHKVSEEKRQRILLTCNKAEYASLPPGQSLPALANQGLYVGSESSLYRVLPAYSQVHRRGRARQPQEPRAVPRLMAAEPNQLWS